MERRYWVQIRRQRSQRQRIFFIGGKLLKECVEIWTYERRRERRLGYETVIASQNALDRSGRVGHTRKVASKRIRVRRVLGGEERGFHDPRLCDHRVRYPDLYYADRF